MNSPINRDVFTAHHYTERQVQLGEITMNYAEAGGPEKPPLLLIPGQTESWWGYEQAMQLLEKNYHVFAIDLRGQGRSTWTPSRYTFDNFGNDVVRFLETVVRRPAIVAGNSSGGVLAAWLAAFAIPGQIRGSFLEDPPLFACETKPAYGHSIHQAAGPMFKLLYEYLGDQWKVGDWNGFADAVGNSSSPLAQTRKLPPEPFPNFQEYDPEWARAFWEGSATQSCPHDYMLSQIKVPILLTHHMRSVDAETGNLIGAVSDFQVAQVKRLVDAAGVPFDYVSLPDAPHQLHIVDPQKYVDTLTRWASRLPDLMTDWIQSDHEDSVGRG